MEKKVL